MGTEELEHLPANERASATGDLGIGEATYEKRDSEDAVGVFEERPLEEALMPEGTEYGQRDYFPGGHVTENSSLREVAVTTDEDREAAARAKEEQPAQSGTETPSTTEPSVPTKVGKGTSTSPGESAKTFDGGSVEKRG